MERKNFNFTTILLVMAAFAIGMLVTKVQYLEKKTEANNNGSLTNIDNNNISLPPSPRYEIKINDNEPIKGEKNASIAIVEYSDFQCPACGSAKIAIEKILEEYKEKVRLVFRQYPLDTNCNAGMEGQLHPNACKAAEASLCAHDQGKFWEMHDKMFSNQNKLAISELKQYAKQIGLDINIFNSCLDQGIKIPQIKENIASGDSYGGGSTPTIFVNGKRVQWLSEKDGWYNALKRTIEAELR